MSDITPRDKPYKIIEEIFPYNRDNVHDVNKSPYCPACGQRMAIVGYEDYGAKSVFICANLLSNPKIHHEYMKAHPEEFQNEN